MRSDTVFAVICGVLVTVLFFLSLSVPLFGDTLGYGYQTTNWIRDNGYTPIVAGEGRGEQAMGHPTLFFWFWALLSGLLGKSLAVARIIPAVSTFFAVLGMYHIGKRLHSRTAGWISAAALLASPLFLIQALRPMPESAVVAAVVWSLYYYIKGSRVKAALLCALGIAFREQAVFLAAAYFMAEFTESRFRRPGRLLLYLSPLLVVVFTGFVNLIANGYFFFPTYMGEGSPLNQGWFFERLRFFGAHLFSEDFRWLLVTAAVAGMLKGRGKDTFSLPFVFALLFPALFNPPERLIFLVFVSGAVTVHMIRERLYTTKLSWVFILVPFLTVMFHVLIVLVSPDSALNLFRYILPAYPFVILGGVVFLYRYYGRATATVLGIVFIIATASANRTVRREFQPDTSLACTEILLDYREAVEYAISLGDTILVSGIDQMYFTNPECGIVETPAPSFDILAGSPLAPGTEYTLVVASFMLGEGNIAITERLLPENSVLVRMDEPFWDDGRNRVHIYRVLPRINPPVPTDS